MAVKNLWPRFITQDSLCIRILVVKYNLEQCQWLYSKEAQIYTSGFEPMESTLMWFFGGGNISGMVSWICNDGSSRWIFNHGMHV